MCELDVTAIVASIAPRDYSASVAELGNDAGRITWEAACEDARELFGDTFDRESFDAYFSGFGAWDDEELAAHTDEECAALMLQFIAGDMREADFSSYADIEGGAEPFTDEWWPQYEKASEAGTVAGRFFRADDGRVFYYIGE